MNGLSKAKIIKLVQTQAEQEGREVGRFCAKQPRTIKEIQRHLGGVNWNRARVAIRWLRDDRLPTKDPFLCVRVSGSNRFLYGFRSQLVPDIAEYLVREMRYIGKRAATNERTIEYCLTTAVSVAPALTAAQRVELVRWSKIVAGQAAAAEQIAAELEVALS